MTFSLVTFSEGHNASGSHSGSPRDSGSPRVGVLLPDGKVVEPTELKRWPSMLDLLDDWPVASSVLDELDPAEFTRLAPISGAELLAPIRWPRKVLCAGVNYRKHVAEMGGSVPDGDWRPYFFLKPPSTTVTGPGDPIVIRDADNARYDWEIELAVVIGRAGRDIPPASARHHIAGYCVANDITARGYHRRESAPAEPFTYDWVAAKAADTSLPLGPGITPAKFITDPQRLRLRLWLNGELQQDETTADMICPVDELVAAASKVVTLEPGDVIATGTPSGVGVARGIALKHNDLVTAAIEGLGQISNRVSDAERSEP
jgi:2-keto-4-pentenoate hydratase/2-oxohepta-3-ene-1,7-dioic acid hydratase in catechol pathway